MYNISKMKKELNDECKNKRITVAQARWLVKRAEEINKGKKHGK